MKLQKLFLIGSIGLNAVASPVQYFLQCDLSGDLVRLASHSVPPKNKPTDNSVRAILPITPHALSAGSTFYTTGKDAYASFSLGDNNVAVYLHSAGYAVPFQKTVAVYVKRPGIKDINLFRVHLQDQGYIFQEGNVFSAMGLNQLATSINALVITCQDIGGTEINK